MTPAARRLLNAYLAAFARVGSTPPRVTSTARTRSQQDELIRQGRGVPNSLHLVGRAADIVPAAQWGGRVTIERLASHAAAWMRVKAIPHGKTGQKPDHVHIEFPA